MSFPILGTPRPAFFDSSGNPLESGTLSVLDPADDTNKAYYPTADDGDALTNAGSGDITLNARGETPNGLYGIDDETYKIVLKDSAAATLWTEDDIRVPTRVPTLFGKTAQTLTDAGAVTLTESTTFLVTTTASAITLADGVENQKKYIVMKTDAGAATLTPSNFSNGTTIIFDDVGDSAELIFINGSWNFVGGSATVTGATAATAITFTSTDATPSVAAGETFITAGTTAITDFDDGVVGQTIKILGASSITITSNAAINLNSGLNFDMVSGDTLTLHMFNDQVWEEISRTVATNTTRSEIVTTTNVIASTESGTTFYLDLAGGFTSTLPAPAFGLKFKFIVKTAPTTAYVITTTSGNNLLYGTLLDIVGELVYFSAQDTLNFVASTSLVGDSLEVESDGTNWYCKAFSGANGGITVAVT